MNGIFFYIGLGLGLALACGLRPFLPVLLAGALARPARWGSASPRGHASTSCRTSWWLLAVAVALVLAYVLQILLGRPPCLDAVARRERGRSACRCTHRPRVTARGRCCSRARSPRTATLRGQDCSAVSPLVGLAQRASVPVIVRARARLADRAAREALTLYLDAASLLLAALVALLHPLGYVALALLAWFVWRASCPCG